MKKSLLPFLLLLLHLTLSLRPAIAQSSGNPFPKTITVTGSAEMLVIPDEIYVNIVLREYQKRGESKKELEAIKSEFLTACQSIGLPDSSISIQAYTGFNNYFWLRKKKPRDVDMKASITYQVKFQHSKQMDDLIEKLDDEATQSFDIAYTSHSKITEFRRQLKIQAVKAAKEKGIYLTEAIGEKLGGAITVREPKEPVSDINLRGVNYSNAISPNQYLVKDGFDKSIEVDFKRIRLRFEVEVVFAIQ